MRSHIRYKWPPLLDIIKVVLESFCCLGEYCPACLLLISFVARLLREKWDSSLGHVPSAFPECSKFMKRPAAVHSNQHFFSLSLVVGQLSAADKHRRILSVNRSSPRLSAMVLDRGASILNFLWNVKSEHLVSCFVFRLYFICLFCVCEGCHAGVEVREQLLRTSSPLPLCVFQGLNSGRQSWWQRLSPPEPSC